MSTANRYSGISPKFSIENLLFLIKKKQISLNSNCVSHFQTDANTAFLRSARAGDLEKLIEFLETGDVGDINASNAVSKIFSQNTQSINE